jgi:hypothetical protein
MAGVVLVVGGLVVTGSSASASQAVGASCTPSDQISISAVIDSSGSSATFTVQNGAVSCDAVAVGLAVYVKDAAGFVTPQQLFTSTTGAITSGSTTLSITLPASGTQPTCFTQIDAFTGAPLPEVTSTQEYGGRLLAWAFGTVPNCVAAQTETTATTAPRGGTNGTRVSAETVTSPSTTVPPAATTTAVEGAELARTGAAPLTTTLAAFGGALVIFGGLLLMRSNERMRRTRS